MSHLSTQSVGVILDHYADVIEGGNAWRGAGTPFVGIPGSRTNDTYVSGLSTIASTAAGSTTSIVAASINAAPSAWVKANTPGFFLRCDSGASDAVDCARRVTGWSQSTRAFTVDAFPVAPGSGATFTALQGYKRLPDGIDIEADETEQPHGYDRFFELSLLPMKQREFYGSGAETWNGELRLKLRLLKYSRGHQFRRSNAENVTFLGSAMIHGDYRDSAYVRALLPSENGPEPIKDDADKTVWLLRFPIVYRVSTTLG